MGLRRLAESNRTNDMGAVIIEFEASSRANVRPSCHAGVIAYPGDKSARDYPT